MGWRQITAALLFACGTPAAMAQFGAIDLQHDQGFAPETAATQEDPSRRLSVSLGAGLVYAPNFVGSDHSVVRLLPIVFLRYDRLFLGMGGLGVNLYRDRRWRFGASLSLAGGRKESADPHLQGLGDIDPTLRAGLFASHIGGWYAIGANVATDIANQNQGTLAKLEALALHRRGERSILFAGPGLTWGDSRYARTFFGVDAQQRARSGLPQHDANAGIVSVRLSAGMSHRLDRRWRIAAIVSSARLQGDAADSPIVERRTQNLFSLSAAYRF